MFSRVGHPLGFYPVLFLGGEVFDAVEVAAVLAIRILEADGVFIGALDDEEAEAADFGGVQGFGP